MESISASARKESFVLSLNNSIKEFSANAAGVEKNENMINIAVKINLKNFLINLISFTIAGDNTC